MFGIILAPLVLFGRSRRNGSPDLERHSHFWFLVNLAERDGEPCAVVSSVFRMTAAAPSEAVIERFEARAREQFPDVVLGPTVESAGEHWRDEAAARRAERLAHWERAGTAVCEVRVPDQPVPDSMLEAQTRAEAEAFENGFHAEQRNDLRTAERWYSRLAALASDCKVARKALTRVREQMRQHADDSMERSG